VGASPLSSAEVLLPARALAGDALEVTNQQGADLVLDSKGDRLLGGFMLGLMDATAMARLHPPHAMPVTAPSPRSALATPGSSPGRLGVAGLLVPEMQITLGAKCPTRDQQPRLPGDHRVGMDDAKVYPCHAARAPAVLLDRDGGGDREPQPTPFGEQRDRPDLLGGVRNGTGQPDPQLRMALRDRQPYPSSLYQKCAVVVADRDQAALSSREPGSLLLVATFGGLEPASL
jgi:hypothetical protein